MVIRLCNTAHLNCVKLGAGVLYASFLTNPHNKKSGGDELGDLASRIQELGNNEPRRGCTTLLVCGVLHTVVKDSFVEINALNLLHKY